MTDYKKYSLGQLENFLYDAMGAAEATPQEIYDVIKGTVQDNYYTYKHQASQSYELLALLNGNGKGHLSCDKDDISTKYKGTWDSFCGKSDYHVSVASSATQREIDLMPPWGHSDMEALKYTDEELDEMCDTAEAKDKVVRWSLSVESDGPSGEYFITFPDDLLEAANLEEGDQIEWIDQGDGSYLMKKVQKKETHKSWAKGNELARIKTHQEMIDDGWTMTDDGFWIKEN